AQAACERGFAECVFAPAPAMLRTLHSKVEFPAFARAHGVPAPNTARVVSASALAGWRDRTNEIVLKPEFSRFASHAKVRPSAGELTTITPTAEAPWAVQDFVRGEEICIWSASISGQVVAFAATNRSGAS